VIITIGHFHRRGYYHTDDLQVFNRGEKGGIYWFTGGLNAVGVGVWALSFAVGLLFTNNEWFTSPGAKLFGGLDLGFLAAGIVAAVAYPLALRMFPEPEELFAPLPSARPTGLR